MKAPITHIAILIAFLINSLGSASWAQAHPAYGGADDFRLPAPGVMVHLSPSFNPFILKGIKVNPSNPFKFDFILDRGDAPSFVKEGDEGSSALKQEATKLIKYFLAGLTIPENDLWVNLSPYEKDRIVPESFGLTEMGRDLLAEDYMLKQITASLFYPEDEIGKKFWKRIYQEAAKKYGKTDIPVNTFNKVWIVPEKAVVYENIKAGTAYVVESRLKVMLEGDYLSLEKHEGIQSKQIRRDAINGVSTSQIVRAIVIPELTKEVNEGKNFAQLRQVYHSLILADWYKKKIRESILTQTYADKKKVAGIGYEKSLTSPEYIYQRYLQAFKKGVYNYIKEDTTPDSFNSSRASHPMVRKYFSGGTTFNNAAMNTAMVFTNKIPVLPDPSRILLVEASIDSLGGLKDRAMTDVRKNAMRRYLLERYIFSPENPDNLYHQWQRNREDKDLDKVYKTMVGFLKILQMDGTIEINAFSKVDPKNGSAIQQGLMSPTKNLLGTDREKVLEDIKVRVYGKKGFKDIDRLRLVQNRRDPISRPREIKKPPFDKIWANLQPKTDKMLRDILDGFAAGQYGFKNSDRVKEFREDQEGKNWGSIKWHINNALGVGEYSLYPDVPSFAASTTGRSRVIASEKQVNPFEQKIKVLIDQLPYQPKWLAPIKPALIFRMMIFEFYLKKLRKLLEPGYMQQSITVSVDIPQGQAVSVERNGFGNEQYVLNPLTGHGVHAVLQGQEPPISPGFWRFEILFNGKILELTGQDKQGIFGTIQRFMDSYLGKKILKEVSRVIGDHSKNLGIAREQLEWYFFDLFCGLFEIEGIKVGGELTIKRLGAIKLIKIHKPEEDPLSLFDSIQKYLKIPEVVGEVSAIVPKMGLRARNVKHQLPLSFVDLKTNVMDQGSDLAMSALARQLTAKAEIDIERLHEILAENGKYYDKRLEGEGVQLLRDIFRQYVEKGGQMEKDLREGRFKNSLLEGLLNQLGKIKPEQAFDYVSKWMVKQHFNNPPSFGIQRMEFAARIIQATQFVQMVLRGELTQVILEGKPAYYPKNSKLGAYSMTDLLNKGQWSCRAISELTVVLMDLWGASDVSLVSVMEGPGGEKYYKVDSYLGKKYFTHVANLVSIKMPDGPDIVAYLDQGEKPIMLGSLGVSRKPKDPKGEVEVLVNNELRLVSIWQIPPNAQGLTRIQILALYKAKDELEGMLSTLGIAPRVSILTEINMHPYTFQTAGKMVRLLSSAIGNLNRLFNLNVEGGLIKVVDLETNFKGLVLKYLEILNAELMQAKQDASFYRLLKRCEKVGLITIWGSNYTYNSFTMKEVRRSKVKEFASIMADIDQFLSGEGDSSIKELVRSLKQGLQGNRRIIRQQVVARLNDLSNKYYKIFTKMQGGIQASAFKELVQEIEYFVHKEGGSPILLDERNMKELDYIYHYAGGNNDLRTIQSGNDSAMRGGVDFTANKTSLRIQNAGEGINFHLDPAMLAQFQNAPGFVPVIINILPMGNLKSWLLTPSL